MMSSVMTVLPSLLVHLPSVECIEVLLMKHSGTHKNCVVDSRISCYSLDLSHLCVFVLQVGYVWFRCRDADRVCNRLRSCRSS